MTLSGNVLAGLPEASRRLATAWFAFAVAALGISTLFALLLIASRTPGVGTLLPGHNFFFSALALHVNLSVVVWVLAAGSALLALVCPPRAIWVGWLALGLGIAGAVLMAMGPLPGTIEVLKSNYIPVLRSWPFMAGLVMFSIAAVLVSLRAILLLQPWSTDDEARPAMIAAYGAAWAVLLAVIAAIWGLALIPGILRPVIYFEQLFWGPGHILQFANMLFMLLAWLWLARHWGLAGASSRLWSRVVLFLGLMPLLAVPVLLFAYPPASAGFKTGFTELMRWGSWLAAVPLGASIFWRLRHQTDIAPGLRTGLQLSILLFFFGIVIGAFIKADNIMVPAHYHGTVGAVTLALMTVCLQQLPRLGFSPVSVSLSRWQLWLYGGGTLTMALSLGVSGWLGVARKLPGDVQALAGSGMLVNPARTISMSFAGLGGAMAVTGSVLFVIAVLLALGRKQQQEKNGYTSAALQYPANRGVYTGLVTVGLVVALGSLYAVLHEDERKLQAFASLAEKIPEKTPEKLPEQIPGHSDPAGHIAAAEKRELDLRFQQAVTMLHAKQYEYAVAALDKVLKIRPNMPEAHVNMGYAMLGMKQYKDAFAHFDQATVLRPMQANAYYGMAEALYELGDIEGAMGAMRSYVHLAPANDPYVNRANAALWEWEETLKKRRNTNVETPGKEKTAPQTARKPS